MKTKITVNHDWLRVVAHESKTRKLSLTISRRGETCSGAGVAEDLMLRALNAFSRYVNLRNGQLHEAKIRLVADLAGSSDTLKAYVGKIEELNLPVGK